MATKTLTITEDAYNRLRALKREDESFSDVVTRLTKGNVDPMASAGSWTGTGLAAAVEGVREELDADLDARAERNDIR